MCWLPVLALLRTIYAVALREERVDRFYFSGNDVHFTPHKNERQGKQQKDDNPRAFYQFH